MAIVRDTVVNIQEYRIKDVDFGEMVDKDFIKQSIDNLKLTSCQANVGVVIFVTSAFKFGAKSQMALEPASNLCDSKRRLEYPAPI